MQAKANSNPHSIILSLTLFDDFVFTENTVKQFNEVILFIHYFLKNV